jgi:hypothetical protein
VAERGLAEYGLPAVVGGHAHRAGRGGPPLRGLKRVGVTIAHHDQVGKLTDALNLGGGRDGGHEDLGGHAEPVRGVRDRDAVVAARRGRHPDRWHVPEQEVGERAARLERSGALQLLQLERHGTAQVEPQVELHDRGPPHIGADHFVGARDVVTGQHKMRCLGVTTHRRVPP